jgi:branched-subunit amino acid transport protein
MTQFLPHVSVAAFVALVIAGLQNIQTNAASWESWLVASLVPGLIAIATTVQQMIAAKQITLPNVTSIISDIENIKASLKAANIKV